MITQAGIDPKARLILIHPNYREQHLVLPYFVRQTVSIYLRFEGLQLNQQALTKQLEAVYDPQAIIDYLVLDECDRARPTALTALLQQLLDESDTIRVVLLMRRLPEIIRRESAIRAQTQIWPLNWGWRLADLITQYSVPHLAVDAFGQGRVYVNGREITKWTSQRARDLFFFMIDNPIITRDVIFETFWSGLSVGAATNVFHVTKASVHKALGFELVQYDGGYYRLTDAKVLTYDVDMFHTLSQHGLPTPDESRLTMANQMYKNDFLQDNQMDWAATRRKELALQFSESMSTLAASRASHDINVALGLYLKALVAYMGREDVAVKIMEIYMQRNQPCDAVAVYERTFEYLKQVVGVGPDKPLKALGAEAQYECEQATSN